MGLANKRLYKLRPLPVRAILLALCAIEGEHCCKFRWDLLELGAGDGFQRSHAPIHFHTVLG